MTKSGLSERNLEGHWGKYSLPYSVSLWSRVMGVVIKSGGAFLILCVAGILIFIVSQALPLAFGARSTKTGEFILPEKNVRFLAVSDDRQFFWVITEQGDLLWRSANGQQWSLLATPSAQNGGFFLWSERERAFYFVGGDNFLRRLHLVWDGERPQFHEYEPSAFALPSALMAEDDVVVDVTTAGNSERRTTALLLKNAQGQSRILAALQNRRRTLLGGESWSEPVWSLPGVQDAVYEKILVPATGDGLLALRKDGVIDYFFADPGGGYNLRQSFLSLEKNSVVTAWGFSFGDVSVIVGGRNGELRRWSLAHSKITGNREFFLSGEWEPLPGAVLSISGNGRNKAVLVAGGREARIINSTTGSVRWKALSGQKISATTWDTEGRQVTLADFSGRALTHVVDDPHPESGFKAFFGPVWYEGRARPDFVWQSTSGTDDFEPKFSLVPLIFGSLKGVFYSLLIALPLSLAGALYVSQMMDPFTRSIVKPTMEWMASIPSVVLGFVGALWLAPLLAPAIPSLMLVILGVPVAVALSAFFWNRTEAGRTGIFALREWCLLVPLAIGFGVVFWHLGPVVEKFFFVIPESTRQGAGVQSDFRMWWREVAGLSFEQRNAFVVGLMMGFAVIPVIFSIAEDAFSNVPASLKLGAQALGASRWQVAREIVLPVAFSGVFSAVMVGMGRAIGETMIVVMVSGNTAILDWNPFSGMRPLSANIAVEMPEAARESTHYRVLFLCALVLFLMCFLLNTAAEFVREKFRSRMKAL